MLANVCKVVISKIAITTFEILNLSVYQSPTASDNYKQAGVYCPTGRA